MPTKPELPPDQAILAAHMTATTAAFQVLITCLQESGALKRGEFPEALRIYIEGLKDRADPMMVTLLGDLRKSLMN